jgi:hypothetical protein
VLSLIAFVVGALFALASASASATTTIGQLDPSPPQFSCSGQQENLQPTVISGTPYVVPAGGVRVVSWSTNALTGSGQVWKMKLYRLVSLTTYKVVGVDGPVTLTPGVVNTFPTNIPAQPGDLLGLTNVNGASSDCVFAAPGENYAWSPGTDTPLGGNATFSALTNFRLNISAVIGEKASNADTLGKVTLNKKKGTATLAVNVPGPGTLTLTGNGVKTQRPARDATASKTVSAAGTVKLLIKAKGKKKKKLNKTGKVKVKVKVKVTYTPTGTGGDVAGDPNTQTKTVKLIKKH